VPPDTLAARAAPLPYGRHEVTDADVAAIVEALRSDWLTTGPRVDEFEQAVADYVGAGEAVAVSSGTAALHAALAALEIAPGDEVIVPALTFVATANAVVYQGATPVFADVERETLLVDPAAVEALVTPRTRAIVAVDYAGQPCDYARLRAIARRHGLALVADGCHALGAAEFSAGEPSRAVGTLADLTAFSLHPVKAITTAEGGLVTTDDAGLARRMRRFRNHGLDCDARARQQAGTWRYEQVELGFNYRLSDVQCALGLSQLQRLEDNLAARRRAAGWYRALWSDEDAVRPLAVRSDVRHAWHLYVVQAADGATRDAIWDVLHNHGIVAAVHYPPVHLHPYYRQRFGTRNGQCPVAEAAAERVLSLPMFPVLREGDVERVVSVVRRAQVRTRCVA
jgi:perosamine synthetase